MNTCFIKKTRSVVKNLCIGDVKTSLAVPQECRKHRSAQRYRLRI